MSTGGSAGQAGSAFVSIGAKLDDLSSALSKAEGMVKSWASRAAAVVTGAFGGISVGKIVGWADDLAKSVKYAGLVFGESANGISAESERMSARFGVSRRNMVQGMTEIGEVFRRIGAGPEVAARMSAELAKSAVAVGKLRDVDAATALQALEYGLEGSTRGLRQLGINLREEQIEIEASRLGFVKFGDSFSETDLTIARASLIMRSLGGVSRALAGEQPSLSTKIASSWASIKHAFEDVGTAILPVANRIVDNVAFVANSISAWVTQHKSDMDAFVGAAVAAFDAFSASAASLWSRVSATLNGIGVNFTWLSSVARDAFDAISIVWRNWGLIAERTGILVMGGIVNIGETFSWLQSTISVFLDWFGTNWKSIFFDAFETVKTALANLGKNFMDFGKSAYDWVASGFSKPFEFKVTGMMEGKAPAATPAFQAPELKLSNVRDQLAEVDDKLLAAEGKHVDALAKANLEGPGAPPKGEVAGRRSALEYPPPVRRPGQAEFMGLADFAKKIQTTALSQQIDYSRQTAAFTARSAVALEQLVKQGAHAAGPPAARAVGPE